MTVSWTGADTGQATLRAQAVRCGSDLQLFATAGDTGVAMILYPKTKVLQSGASSATSADLPILAPTEARETRPAAAIAARWLDSARVSGYRGVEGTVRVGRRGDRLTGQFRALLRRDGDLAEVTLGGRFARVRVGACPDSAG